MSGSGGSCVASLILCSTISSSYSSLDPLCYDHQLTGLYLVRQLTINSLLIIQYIQSNTSTQLDKISSLTEVTLTKLGQHLFTSPYHRRSDAVPPTRHIGDPDVELDVPRVGTFRASSKTGKRKDGLDVKSRWRRKIQSRLYMGTK